MKKKRIIIWGATGQCIVLEEFLSNIGYKLIAIFDNHKNVNSPFENIPIFYGIEGFNNWLSFCGNKEIFFLTAIGGDKGKDRLDIFDFLENKKMIPATVIHPTAFVAKSSVIGKGSQILAQSAISSRVKLGKSVIVNTSSSIDHECCIGDGVHIGPGAKLAGCVNVGNLSFIGTGAILLPRVKIGVNSIVGAGAIVTKDVPDNVVVYGNPAKIIREKK